MAVRSGKSLVLAILTEYALLLTTSIVAEVVPITVGVVLIGDHPTFGYAPVHVAYDAAFKYAQWVYPRVFQNLTRITRYQPGNFSCAESSNEQIVQMAELYEVLPDNKEPTFILGPGH